MIELQNVSKSFEGALGTVHALQDVNITVNKGDIFGVIGFSGAGKSTLVRTVNRLEKPDSGRVLVNGTDITTLVAGELRRVRKGIGMIFQQFNLLNTKTVFQNVAAPLVINKTPKKEIEKRVAALLSFVGLEDKIHTNVSRLSGGQKQRVGIARALATEPEILLCDEATSALDPKTTDSILALLKKVNQELGVTILLITHEMHVIRDICSHVAVMDGGRVLEQGKVLSVFGNPRHEITKSFVRQVINDRLPPRTVSAILRDGRENFILKIKLCGDTVNDPLLYDITKKFGISNSILFANVCQLEGTIYSVMIVQFFGGKEQEEQIKAYIGQKGFSAERLALPTEEVSND